MVKVKVCSTLQRIPLDSQMVEVPGVEPGSEDHTQKGSTCLFQYLGLTARVSTEQDTRAAILL